MEVSNVASKRLSDDEITISNHSSLFLNGRITNNRSLIKPLLKPIGLVKNKKVYADPSSNHWSSSENNSVDSWVVYFGDGGFGYGGYKSIGFVVRPCVALGNEEITGWLLAYEDCCRRKKSTIQCSIYRSGYEKDLLRLIREIKTRTYIPSTSTCFVVSRPKYREIFAANFRNRIVQHWIILRLEPFLEKRFIS